MSVSSTSLSGKKVRQSNFELLRILAMFGVLALHANFMSLGYFDPANTMRAAIEAPKLTLFSILAEALCLCSVNLFVLISGYFSIRLSLTSIGNFVFSVLFYAFGLYAFSALMMGDSWGIKDFIIYLLSSFSGINGMWFVGAYLVLMLISPILNLVAESFSQRKFLLVIVVFYCIQTVLDWGLGGLALFANSASFSSGYSWLSLAGIYWTGRYLRLYPLPIQKNIFRWNRSNINLTLGGGDFNTCLGGRLLGAIA